MIRKLVIEVIHGPNPNKGRFQKPFAAEVVINGEPCHPSNTIYGYGETRTDAVIDALARYASVYRMTEKERNEYEVQEEANHQEKDDRETST